MPLASHYLSLSLLGVNDIVKQGILQKDSGAVFVENELVKEAAHLTYSSKHFQTTTSQVQDKNANKF